MKNLSIFSILFILILTGCGPKKEGQRIEGNIPDFANLKVTLQKFENNLAVQVDSASIDADGNFEVYVPVNKMDFFQLIFSNNQQIGLALSPGEDVELSLSTGENFPEKLNVEGSPNTAKMIAFFETCAQFEASRNEVVAQVQQLGNPPTDTKKQQDLIAEINKQGKAYYDYVVSFTKENASSPVAFSSLTKLNIQRDFELFKLVVSDLKPIMADNGYYQSLAQQVEQIEGQLVAQEAKKRLQEKLAPGKEAPEIVLNNPEGKPVALSSLRGKYVLIDFWASWCRPCRAENPNVVAMYKKYKRKGFEIYSVSLDRTKDAWVNAIKQDGLTWTHVSDLKFWQSEGAKTYGVSGIPFTVLIDKEGKIIATNIRGESLRNKMKEIFGA